MTVARQTLGQWGEDQAATFLARNGMKILARNVRTPVGEIDIVARSGSILAFVEVKTRRTRICGVPADAVGPHKQRQIIRAAQWYLNDTDQERLQPRFDVVTVLLVDDRPHIEHIPDAFTL